MINVGIFQLKRMSVKTSELCNYWTFAYCIQLGWCVKWELCGNGHIGIKFVEVIVIFSAPSIFVLRSSALLVNNPVQLSWPSDSHTHLWWNCIMPSSSDLVLPLLTFFFLFLLAKATTLFSKHTKAIVWGMQTRAVQGMMDFDYVCSRDEPSVAAMVYPFT